MIRLPEVDEEASIQQARDLLKRYRSLSRIAGVRLTDIRSPQLDGMPKTQGYGNQVEDRLIKHLNAEIIINDINTAMQYLNDTSAKVLYYSYCSANTFTYYQIASKIGYSEGSIDKLKSKATLEFAESYKHGELLIFK